LLGIGVFPAEAKQSALKVVEAVEEAERAGFDRAWIADTQGIFCDPYVTLTLCATRAERIPLGIAVTNPVTRHPTVTARAISTLEQIWPGRYTLGLGAGDTSLKHLGLKPLRAEECEEAVHCLRSLLAGEEARFHGRKIQNLSHHEGNRMPIYLAANGPRMLRTAGRCADGVIASVGVAPELVQYVVDTVGEGAKSAGRDPKEVRIGLHVGCDISENREKARENSKTYVARRVIAPLPPELTGFTKEEKEEFRKAYSLSGHLQVDAPHAQMVREEWIDRFALAGNPGECLEKLNRFAEQGVHEVILLPTTAHSVDLIRVCGQSLIPRLR
jgi:5,10-methylenetetrahydromethanopterin reductase